MTAVGQSILYNHYCFLPVQQSRNGIHFHPFSMVLRSSRNEIVWELSMLLSHSALLIDLVSTILFGCDRLMWEKWNYFHSNCSKATDVNAECRNYLPHTKKSWKYSMTIRWSIISTVWLLTQLISFGPIAGDAFSVSDEWISLFRSTSSSIKLFFRLGGRDETDFLRFSITWPFSEVFSSAGNREKRCAYVMTMESFSIELSDGRRLRSTN